jgi:NADH-quinone oxidoreductase subunit E
MQNEVIDKILENYSYDDKKLIPILQAVQEEEKYLSEETMQYVAEKLNVPETQVFGVASFYSHFALEAKGKYIIRLCNGTACHVRKSEGIKIAIQEALGLADKEYTTKDMLFTLEIVSCLGACGLAPVVVINEDVYGQVTPEKIKQLIADIKQREGGK